MISFNTKTREFQYSCGGGEFAIYQNNNIKIYKGNSYPIGGWQIEKNRKFDTYNLRLEEEAKLYFFSDGVKHQFDSTNTKKFSRKRLLNVLEHYNASSMCEQKDLFEFVLNTWQERTTQTDDITLIGIEF